MRCFEQKSRTSARVGQDFVSILALLAVTYALYNRPLTCEANALTTELTAQNHLYSQKTAL